MECHENESDGTHQYPAIVLIRQKRIKLLYLRPLLLSAVVAATLSAIPLLVAKRLSKFQDICGQEGVMPLANNACN